MSTEDNKRLVRSYFDEFHSNRRVALAGDILGPELRDETLNMTRMFTAAFPDYQITITDQVAEGDKVATVWTARGTHQGTWMSPIGPIPPTARQITWTGTTTLRLLDGMIVEVIGSNWDHLGILQAVGAAPDVAPRSGA